MSLFNPSRDEVRTFFIKAWDKVRGKGVPTALETLAGSWIEEHPEYHSLLADTHAKDAEFTPEQGQSNPFLHLSMHLSISEQVSIDQPPGIRAATEKLAARLGSLHEAHHVVMECLGEMLWNAQRTGQPPDARAYLESIERAARG